jgi:hypothetical protein
LPPLDQIYPPLRKKPAATVLVEAARQANSFGPLIVIAEHTVGRGRVVYVGTDTLWKWQMLGPTTETGQTPHRLFWQQALRALAPTRRQGGPVNLFLQPERSRYEAGQRAVVRAEIEAPKALTQPTLQAAVTLPNGRRLPLSFAVDAGNPNMAVAEFETGKPGAYQITASVLAQDKAAADSTTVIDVDEIRGEKDGTPVDLANLARIAAATGGMVIDPGNPDTWPASSVRERERVPQTRMIDLWNGYTLLLLLCVLLGLDWLLRLLRGYV